MSDILIHGMEMPKEYAVVVKIFPDGRVGAVPYIQWFKVDLIEEAQAVPVPNNGRLIDADAFAKYLFSAYGMDSRIKSWIVDIFIREVENAPTIIPARKEGER